MIPSMADRLYLSLWYPNFRLETLPAALTGVLRQFAVIGAKRVSAASAYPINFTEPPTYQRIYVTTGQSSAAPEHLPPGSQPPAADPDSIIETAVSEATEQLHDDMAYEFEMRWQLWTPEDPASSLAAQANEEDFDLDEEEEGPVSPRSAGSPGAGSQQDPWKLRTHAVRILGFGPTFDMAGFEQNGHLLVDFGLDTPWVLDMPLGSPQLEQGRAPGETAKPKPLDSAAQLHIQQNIEKLLAFTLLVEKHCGISSRLLWTESGEPLAEKLIARLQRVN
jgi:hypothetical protein